MKLINYLKRNIITWLYFGFIVRNFRIQSFKLQGIKLPTVINDATLAHKLNKINDQRIDIVKQISKLTDDSEIYCTACGGKCCLGNYNHFSILDYIMRYSSDRPVSEFGIFNKIEPLSIVV